MQIVKSFCRPIAIVLGCLIVLVAGVPAAAFQDAQSSEAQQHPLVSAAGYRRILDAIFPRDDNASLKVAYTMVLRFEPNHGPEEQLLLRVWYDRHADVVHQTVKDGNAWVISNAFIAKTGREDSDAIVKLIAVERRQLPIDPALVARWHKMLFVALRKSGSKMRRAAKEYEAHGTSEAVLDGARYEFWYQQGDAELRWSFFDTDLTDSSLTSTIWPLARWMNLVRIAASKSRDS